MRFMAKKTATPSSSIAPFHFACMCSIDAGPADEGAQLLIFVAPAAHSVQEDSKGGFMYKFLNVALIICAGMCTAIVCASAQSEGQNANGKPAAAVRPLVDYSP